MFMKNLDAENVRKDFTEEYKCKWENCMSIEYNEWGLDYWKLPNGEYIVKFTQHDGLKCETDIKNTLPVHFRSFIMVNSWRMMKNCLPDINGFQTNNVY